MGLSYSLFLSSFIENLKIRLFGFTEKPEKVVVRSFSFDSNHGEMTLRTVSFKKRDSDNNEVVIEEPMRLQKQKPKRLMLETTVSFRNNLIPDGYKYNFDLKEKGDALENKSHPTRNLPEPVTFFSPRPLSELDAAAVKVQKVYKSYRTRRNLADCAVVVEELWWKALDFAALKRSSVSFFDLKKPETAVSRWTRARTRAAKVGKGLSKDEKAQKLALRHWLEAIDPRHRYGHNLHLYYDIWFGSESSQPFFYWLDVGDGKELNLENCPRTVLQRQCIKYLGPKEREAYEVIVDSGKLVYRHTRLPVDTVEGSKWIFVLSTSRNLYVGQKKKGLFQHSSFLAGGATTAAGRLVAHDGVLEAVWPYSGHYHPTEENFLEFISFLGEHHVSLTNVKRCAIDDDDPSIKLGNEEPHSGSIKAYPANIQPSKTEAAADANGLELGKRLSCQWTTGAGPRISCVRDYPAELQFQALEQVNLSPRLNPGHFSGSSAPIPSPRPSPKIRLSPRLAHMGLPSPRLHVSSTN